jgi:hypothetical protein
LTIAVAATTRSRSHNAFFAPIALGRDVGEPVL